MGMIGKFMSVDYQDLEAILSGEESILSLENELAVDIDKAWQAIGYLLCGSLFDTDDAPMCYVVPMMGENVISEEEDEDEFFQYVYHHFLNLKSFYKSAAQEGKAIIFYIM